MTFEAFYNFYSHADFSHVLTAVPGAYKHLAKSKSKFLCFDLLVDEIAVSCSYNLITG
jgi:hypothetical protein